MKIPKLLIRPPAKKKLRASTARRSMAAPEEMDYEEMSEPNMKLSRALLIVLVLHVVAVAGIIAFNTIKSRQGAFPQQRQEAKAAPTAAPAEVAPATVAKTEPSAAPMTSQAATAMLQKPAAKEDPKQLEKIPKALPVSNADTASGNFYVVAKGDNPVSIAKKLKVSQSELLAANNIDDPRKLQIGQKLIVPTPKKAKSKSDAN